MQFYQRSELERLLKSKWPRYKGGVKEFCEKNEIYYEGLVRFLNGKDYTIHSYTKLLEALKLGRTIDHAMAEKLTYDQIGELMEFIKIVNEED